MKNLTSYFNKKRAITLIMALVISLSTIIMEPLQVSASKKQTAKTSTTSSTTVKKPAAPWASQSKYDYSSDAKLAIDKIEKTHMIFVDGMLPDNYEEVKAEFLNATAQKITKTEFLLAFQKYLTILHDGHMGLGFFRETGKFIDINWISVDSKLYLKASDGMPATEVTMIGGVPTSDVMKQVATYYGVENDAALQLAYSKFCRQIEMLWLAGCSYDNSNVTITFSDKSTKTYNILDAARTNIMTPTPTYVAKHKMVDDVFVIDLRTFIDDSSVNNMISAIETAVACGTKKFIVDLRGNRGGYYDIGEKIVKAMGITPPQTGRISKMRNMKIAPSLSNAINKNNVSVYVLTDAESFSAATTFGCWIQDAKFGKIIGQASSNAPNYYATTTYVTLPTARIDIRISNSKNQRPDVNNTSDTLVPDILVPLNKDSMTIALEEFKKQK